MRRTDREVTEQKKINEIVSNCYCCRIGFCEEGEVYIVPLNFGYEEKEGKYTFYFHSAREGRKINMIRKQNSVGFEMDGNYQLKESETPCNYSAFYQSVIGTGKISFVNDTKAKKRALRLIMKHTTGKEDWDFSDEMLDCVCVFQLEVEKLSCKENRKQDSL